MNFGNLTYIILFSLVIFQWLTYWYIFHFHKAIRKTSCHDGEKRNNYGHELNTVLKEDRLMKLGTSQRSLDHRTNLNTNNKYWNKINELETNRLRANRRKRDENEENMGEHNGHMEVEISKKLQLNVKYGLNENSQMNKTETRKMRANEKEWDKIEENIEKHNRNTDSEIPQVSQQNLTNFNILGENKISRREINRTGSNEVETGSNEVETGSNEVEKTKEDNDVKEELNLKEILREKIFIFRKRHLVEYFKSKNWSKSRITYIKLRPFTNIPCYEKTKYDINFEKLIVSIERSLGNVDAKLGPIIFLYADSHRPQELINWWLMAKFVAKMELHNLIVATDDVKLSPIISKLSINTIFIDSNMRQTSKTEGHTTIWTYRMIIWRLLISYGYDVFNFDTDAVILHDPIGLINEQYSDGDIVSSMTDKAPKIAMKEWGFTMCMGNVLFRKEMNSRTSFWRFLDDMCMAIKDQRTNDQDMINMVLLGGDTVWNNNTQIDDPFGYNPGNITGVTTDGLIVRALSSSEFCRLTCFKGRYHYVWHTRFDHKNWLLKNDWEKMFFNVTDVTDLVNQTLYFDLRDYNVTLNEA